MNLRDEYQAYMRSYSPAIDDLPGDLRSIATVIEANAPGWGVKMTMHLAKQLNGLSTYWPSLSSLPEACEYAMERTPIQKDDSFSFSAMELPTNHLRIVAAEAMQFSPKIGLHITLRLAGEYQGQETLWHTVDWLINRHRRKWVESRYGLEGVTAWDVAYACGLSLSVVEKIGGGGYENRKRDPRQTSILELL